MFDTRKIGNKIAALRKEKDLTQVELADQMMVSYQAVSNWERGNSLPDISKLVELSQILGVSIEELLDSDKGAHIVEKMISHPEEVSFNEAVKIAPILKPSKVEEIVEETRIEVLDPELLIDIAPYISAEKLFDTAKKLDFAEIGDAVGLAPFLYEEQLSDILKTHAEKINGIGELVGFAPFLSDNYLIELIRMLPQKATSVSDLVGLAPFLRGESLERLLEALPEDQQVSDEVVGLAPFLKSRYVTQIAKKALNNGNKSLFEHLLPFMDHHDLF